MSSRPLVKSNLNVRLPETSPPSRSFCRLGGEVPHTPLGGRAKEIADTSTLVQEPRAQLVTLTGPDGVGKTRLAPAAPHAARNAFAHAVMLVPLGQIAGDRLVCAAIARSLDLRVMGDELIIAPLDTVNEVIMTAIEADSR